MRWIVLLLALITATEARAQVSVSMQSLSVEPGSTFTIPVDLTNVEAGTPVQAFEFVISSLGTALTFLGGDYSGSLVSDSGWTKSCNTAIQKCLGFTSTQGAFRTSGKLVGLRLVAGSQQGSVTLALENVRFNGGNPTHTPLTPAVTITVGSGGESNTAPTAPLMTSPPVVVIGGEPSETAFTLDWTASTDSEGDPISYVIEFAMDEGFADPITSVDVQTALSHSFDVEQASGLMAAVLTRLGREVSLGETVLVWTRVKAFDGQKFTSSTALSITMVRAAIVSGETLSASSADGVQAFPNPATNRLELTWNVSSGMSGELRVVDVLGRIRHSVRLDSLSSRSTGGTVLDISDWASGHYAYYATITYPGGQQRVFRGGFIKIDP